jgi:hypothetical protein
MGGVKILGLLYLQLLSQPENSPSKMVSRFDMRLCFARKIYPMKLYMIGDHTLHLKSLTNRGPTSRIFVAAAQLHQAPTRDLLRFADRVSADI